MIVIALGKVSVGHVHDPLSVVLGGSRFTHRHVLLVTRNDVIMLNTTVEI
jgi:hypothetical protein